MPEYDATLVFRDVPGFPGFPRPIDLTAYTKTVDYEFRDPEDAAEFAALNHPAGKRRGAA